MRCDAKRVLAAIKAATTLRLNLLNKLDLDEVKQLCIQIKEKEFEINEDFSREAIIAREVAPTTWKSFCRFGDKNRATPGLILYWIDRKGMTLDEQALWIANDYNLEVLPEELADFIAEHDRGKSQYRPYQELEALYLQFKVLTGFKWNLKFVNQHILSPILAKEEMPF